MLSSSVYGEPAQTSAGYRTFSETDDRKAIELDNTLISYFIMK